MRIYNPTTFSLSRPRNKKEGQKPFFSYGRSDTVFAGGENARLALASQASAALRRASARAVALQPRSPLAAREIKKKGKSPSFVMVGATRFERATSCSQSRRATSCATPRYSIVSARIFLWVGRRASCLDIRSLPALALARLPIAVSRHSLLLAVSAPPQSHSRSLSPALARLGLLLALWRISSPK